MIRRTQSLQQIASLRLLREKIFSAATRRLLADVSDFMIRGEERQKGPTFSSPHSEALELASNGGYYVAHSRSFRKNF